MMRKRSISSFDEAMGKINEEVTQGVRKVKATVASLVLATHTEQIRAPEATGS